jgi:hypothetical protein
MKVNGQLHAPATLPLGKRVSVTHWIEGWVGPRAGLDAMKKRQILPLPGSETRTSSPQPIAIPTEQPWLLVELLLPKKNLPTYLSISIHPTNQPSKKHDLVKVQPRTPTVNFQIHCAGSCPDTAFLQLPEQMPYQQNARLPAVSLSCPMMNCKVIIDIIRILSNHYR